MGTVLTYWHCLTKGVVAAAMKERLEAQVHEMDIRNKVALMRHSEIKAFAVDAMGSVNWHVKCTIYFYAWGALVKQGAIQARLERTHATAINRALLMLQWHHKDLVEHAVLKMWHLYLVETKHARWQSAALAAKQRAYDSHISKLSHTLHLWDSDDQRFLKNDVFQTWYWHALHARQGRQLGTVGAQAEHLRNLHRGPVRNMLFQMCDSDDSLILKDVYYVWREHMKDLKVAETMRKETTKRKARQLCLSHSAVGGFTKSCGRLHLQCMLRSWQQYIAQECQLKEKVQRLKAKSKQKEVQDYLTMCVSLRYLNESLAFQLEVAFHMWWKIAENQRYIKLKFETDVKVKGFRDKMKNDVRFLMINAVMGSDALKAQMIFTALARNVAEARDAHGVARVTQTQHAWRSSLYKNNRKFVDIFEALEYAKVIQVWKLAITLDQKDQFASQARDLHQQTKELTVQCSNVSQKSDEYQSQCENLSGRCNDYDSQCQELSRTIDDGRTENLELTVRFRDMERVAAQHQSQSQHLSRKVEDYEAQCQHLAKTLDEHRAEQFEISNRYHNLEQKAGDQESQNEHLSRKVVDYDSQCQQLLRAVDDKRAEHNELSNRYHDLDRKANEQQSQVEHLSRACEDYESQKQDLSKKIADGRSECNELSLRCREFERNANDFESQCEDLSRKCTDYDSQRQELHKRLEDTKAENRDFATRCHELERRSDEYQSQGEHLSQRCDDYEFQTQNLVRKLEEFKSENRDLQQKCDSYRNQCQDLTDDVQKAVAADLRDLAANAELKDQLASQILLNEQHSDHAMEHTHLLKANLNDLGLELSNQGTILDGLQHEVLLLEAYVHASRVSGYD
jgi:uncharacterized coiled-coil DUF342 family protein